MYCVDLLQFAFLHTFSVDRVKGRETLQNLAKLRGIYQIMKEKFYDKSTFHLPRHSSFMIMHTFADWGNTGQNMAESLGITTVSTTKAHGRNRDKGKGVGRNP